VSPISPALGDNKVGLTPISDRSRKSDLLKMCRSTPQHSPLPQDADGVHNVLQLPEILVISALHYLDGVDLLNFTTTCKASHEILKHPVIYDTVVFTWPLQYCSEVAVEAFELAARHAQSDNGQNPTAAVAVLLETLDSCLATFCPEKRMETIRSPAAVLCDAVNDEFDILQELPISGKAYSALQIRFIEACMQVGRVCNPTALVPGHQCIRLPLHY
jgi:hypothetical protein